MGSGARYCHSPLYTAWMLLAMLLACWEPSFEARTKRFHYLCGAARETINRLIVSRSGRRSRPAPYISIMTPEEFRRFGHQLIDWIADYRTSLAERPVMARSTPGEIKDQLPAAPPQQPED